MELREAGHTQLLANFARFFKAKRDQGSYEVLTACCRLLASDSASGVTLHRSRLRSRIFGSSEWMTLRTPRRR
jgi:hypothetical protein